MKILKKWNLKDAFCRQTSETDFELGNRYFCRRIWRIPHNPLQWTRCHQYRQKESTGIGFEFLRRPLFFSGNEIFFRVPLRRCKENNSIGTGSFGSYIPGLRRPPANDNHPHLLSLSGLSRILRTKPNSHGRRTQCFLEYTPRTPQRI